MPSPASIAIRDLTFSYDSANGPLLSGANAHFPIGFTGIIGANGTGKTTLLRLLTGALRADGGSIEGVSDTVYCDQRTDHPPADLQVFLDDWSGIAFELRGRLDIGTDVVERWDTLSHGERKRVQIGHALWHSPSLLAIDEPTNHIDADARALLLDSLKRYQGVGLLVSHDRAFLDQLCSQCIWLEPPKAECFAGGYSEALDARQSVRETLIREHQQLSRESARLEREMARRREQTSREHKVRSKRGLSNKDHDGKGRINAARVTDSKSGSRLRQLDGRSAQTQTALRETRLPKEYDTGIWLSGSRSQRDHVLSLAAGSLPLGGGRTLNWPGLLVRPDERIAITGANGCGKTSFLRHMLPRLNADEDRIIDLPQEVSADRARQLMDEIRAYPGAQLGTVMTIVSRLNSRPQRLLESHQPSPGEIRKLLLALGMSRAPHCIIMDEPTNHLDLPSMAALEEALAGCPCALLLVSHDQRFISNVDAQIWQIEVDDQGDSLLIPC